MKSKKNITKKNLTKKNKSKRFTKKDYSSHDGMLTTIWGPGLWHALHTMSFNYPVNPTKDDKNHYRNFILQLRWVLPCGKCRKNFINNLKKLPLKMNNMKSRDTFSKYVYELHELINNMLDKKSYLSYDDVRERYEHFRARCKPEAFNKLLKKTVKKINEKGCVEPLKGKKSKCVLKIVPQEEKCDTFQVDVDKL